MDYGDPRQRADWLRDELKNAAQCHVCKRLDPARIGPEGCSWCYDGWPRCDACGGWSDVGDHEHGREPSNG
jgi:hypothetical protein